MLLQRNIQHIPFKKWIWKSRENKGIIICFTAITLLEFICFKFLFPYPNFLPDSYSYLEAAFNNQSIDTWPIGYSKFLRLISTFSHNDTFLILFQYLLLQGAVAYFLFTISYFLNIGKWAMRILFLFVLLNPIILLVSNFISSDSLFATLSLVWFTQLLWIVSLPSARLIFIHIIILLFAFSVRHNALYYPIASIVCITFSQLKQSFKILSIAMTFISISLFVRYTVANYQKITGTSQFSAFGGWQLASNALFAYSRITHLQQKVPTEFTKLHAITNRHMDSLRKVNIRPDDDLGVYYLWDDHAPLKAYMYQYKNDDTSNGFKRWAAVAPLYFKYGVYIIKNHPIAFAEYYICPNIVKYYVPYAEFLASYNMYRDTVENIAKTWFHYKTNKIKTSIKDKHIIIAEYIPISLALINLLFVLCFAGFAILNGFKKNIRYINKILFLVLGVWVCNFAFSVLASPIVLRYQTFPMIITSTFMLILLTYIFQESKTQSHSIEHKKDQSKDVQVSLS